MNNATWRKIGMILLCVGILAAVSFYAVKMSNQPIHVSSSFGSGYMGGWSQSTMKMLDAFSVLGLIEAILGFVLLIFFRKKK